MATTGVLVAGMLVTGAANSIFSKFQDKVCVQDCQTRHPKSFEQPVYQTLQMFLGELACLFALQILNSRLFRPQTPRGYDKINTVLDAATHPEHLEPSQHAPRAIAGATEVPIALAVDPDAVVQDPVRHLTGRRQALLCLPALFDLTGTTLMNVGLLFTPVSIYQMTRSALVLFVGAFSVAYLGRKLNRSEVLSLVVVFIGVFIVGLSSATGKDVEEAAGEGVGKVIAGILLILFAQVFTASQFVVEEKIMSKYSVEPLRAVGLEGFFGFSTTILLMAVLFVTVGNTPAGRGGIFDVRVGWHQMWDNPPVWVSSIAICISIAFFNFFGLAVTKTVSATARSTIDCSRTVVIWIVSMLLGWERFKFLQLIGFAALVYGTFVFNGVASFPWLPAQPNEPTNKAREDTPLLEEQR